MAADCEGVRVWARWQSGGSAADVHGAVGNTPVEQVSLDAHAAGRGRVDLARLAGGPTMVTRYRKPAAVIVSADWYETAEEVLASAAHGSGRRKLTAQAGGKRP